MQRSRKLRRTLRRMPKPTNFISRARYFWNKRTPETIKKSIEFFQKAIEKDPNYALGYAGLSDGYTLLLYYHGASAAEAFPKSQERLLSKHFPWIKTWQNHITRTDSF